MCQSRKDKVHLAEETQDYDSDESLLKVEEITAINGRGKQLTSKIKIIVDRKYKEQLLVQLDTGANCNVISLKDLTQLAGTLH